VVPATTIPSLPSRTWKSSNRSHAGQSKAPSGIMGVTIATKLPENIKELRGKYSYLKCLTAPKASAHPVEFGPMKQHIVISAVGGDRVGMVHELSKAIADCGGSISESRMTSLGNEFAMLLLVNGNWHTLAKLEGEFKKLADATGMNIQLRRTEERSARNDMLPYSIDVVCLDQTGIVAGLSGFFAQRGVDIAELSTRSYAAAHTGAPMFSVQMIVNVPSRLHIGVLREEFMDFCDHLNLDAIFEPVKS
jgi:glycine cleavage system transcriptional repressor